MKKDKLKYNKTPEALEPDTYKPKIYRDISVTVLFEKKEGSEYCIGSVERDAYIKATQSQVSNLWKCISLMNGILTITEIQSEMEIQRIAVNVYQLVMKLLSVGLLEDENYMGRPFDEASRLTFPLCSVDIKRLSGLIQPFSHIIVFFVLVLLGLGLVIFSYLLLENKISIIDLVRYKNSYIKSFIFSSLLAIPIFITHEFAHVIVAGKYKLYAAKMNFALYFGFIPMAYVRIPGIYTLQRNKRIKIMSAGMIWNITLGITLTVVSYLFNIEILKIIALSNFQIALVNLSPLSLSDGYFLMCNLMKVSNLRMNFFKAVTMGKQGGSKAGYSLITWVYIGCTSVFMGVMSVTLGNSLLRKIIKYRVLPGIEPSSVAFTILHITVCIICIILCFVLVRLRFKALKKSF